MKFFLLIGTGGFIGSILRYSVYVFLQRFFTSPLPIGTLVVNVVGSFVIGIVYVLSEQKGILNPEFRAFLTVGFCGGFTTFSSFAYENFSLLNSQNFLFSVLYTALSLILGLFSVYLAVHIFK